MAQNAKQTVEANAKVNESDVKTATKLVHEFVKQAVVTSELMSKAAAHAFRCFVNGRSEPLNEMYSSLAKNAKTQHYAETLKNRIAMQILDKFASDGVKAEKANEGDSERWATRPTPWFKFGKDSAGNKDVFFLQALTTPEGKPVAAYSPAQIDAIKASRASARLATIDDLTVDAERRIATAPRSKETVTETEMQKEFKKTFLRMAKVYHNILTSNQIDAIGRAIGFDTLTITEIKETASKSRVEPATVSNVTPPNGEIPASELIKAESNVSGGNAEAPAN